MTKKWKKHYILGNYLLIKLVENKLKYILKLAYFLLILIFEIFTKSPDKEYDINQLFCVILPGYTSECCMKDTTIMPQTFQHEDTIILLEIKIEEA